MRRLVGLAVVCVAAAFVPVAFSTPAEEGVCEANSHTVLFAPRGHLGLPSIELPEHRAPHVEAYTYAGASTYDPGNLVAYADVKGIRSLVRNCARIPDHARVRD